MMWFVITFVIFIIAVIYIFKVEMHVKITDSILFVMAIFVLGLIIYFMFQSIAFIITAIIYYLL